MAVAYKSVGSVTCSSATTINVNPPSSYATGDLLVLIHSHHDGLTPNSTPTGWTLIGSTVSSAGPSVTAYWKTAASSSESSVTITCGSSSGDNDGIMMAFSGASSTVPVFGYTACNPDTSSTLTAPSITSTATGSYRVVAYVTATWNQGYGAGGMTQVEGFSGGNTHPGIFVAAMATAGASGSTTHSFGPTSGAAAMVFGVQPTPPAIPQAPITACWF